MDKVYVLYAQYEDSENFKEFVAGIYRSKNTAEEDKYRLEIGQKPVSTGCLARLDIDCTSYYGYRIEEFPLISVSHAHYKKYVAVQCANRELLKQIRTLYSQYRYKTYDLDRSRYYATYALELHIPGDKLDKLIDEWGMTQLKNQSYRNHLTYNISDSDAEKLLIKLKEESTCQNTQ